MCECSSCAAPTRLLRDARRRRHAAEMAPPYCRVGTEHRGGDVHGLRSGRLVTIGLLDGIAAVAAASCSAGSICGSVRASTRWDSRGGARHPRRGGRHRPVAEAVGRGRALDILLTGRDVGADELLAIGWLDRLVRRPSSTRRSRGRTPDRSDAPEAVAAVKRIVDAPQDQALLAESDEVARLLVSGEHRDRMTRFIAAGGQTREAETTRMQSILETVLETGPLDQTRGDIAMSERSNPSSSSRTTPTSDRGSSRTSGRTARPSTSTSSTGCTETRRPRRTPPRRCCGAAGTSTTRTSGRRAPRLCRPARRLRPRRHRRRRHVPRLDEHGADPVHRPAARQADHRPRHAARRRRACRSTTAGSPTSSRSRPTGTSVWRTSRCGTSRPLSPRSSGPARPGYAASTSRRCVTGCCPSTTASSGSRCGRRARSSACRSSPTSVAPPTPDTPGSKASRSCRSSPAGSPPGGRSGG